MYLKCSITTSNSSFNLAFKSKHNSLLRHTSINENKQFLFISYCTMQGILYLIQSLNLECLSDLITFIFNFIMIELSKMQRSADILTDLLNLFYFNLI